MKKYLFCLLLCCSYIISYAQVENDAFNQSLADSLGADDYGMKAYTLVILKTGKAKIPEKHVVDSLFRGHLDNINRLATSGDLIIAGPLGKNEKSYRGIFVLTETDLVKAEILLSSDPAIKEGLLAYELFSWYGAAALSTYLDLQKRITRIKP